MARREEFQMIEMMIMKAQELDLCFLLDATGSMQDTIDMVKDKVAAMTGGINAAYPECSLRVSLVLYRDYDDPNTELNKSCNFAADFNGCKSTFIKALSIVRAEGGAETGEYVFTGLQRVADLDWQAGNRLLVHICDAPCTGTRFHDSPTGNCDKYSNGGKLGQSIANLLHQLRDRCQVTHYYFCHLNDSTKKMVQEFKTMIGEVGWIEDVHFRDIERIPENVVSVSRSIINKTISTTINKLSSGSGSQLLSSKRTEYMLQSVEELNCFVTKTVKEAEAEGVFPRIIDRNKASLKKWCKEQERRWEMQDMMRREDINRELAAIRNDFAERHKSLMNVVLKILDVGNIFLKEKEYTCPRYIYLGDEKSGDFKSLKKVRDTLFLSKKVHLHFFCEAEYDNYGLHPVANQAGIDIAGMKEWVKAVVPWLKVSLTVFLMTATTTLNVCAPGAGTLVSSFAGLLMSSGIADGLERGTGYSKRELDALIGEGSGAEAGFSKDRPGELCGWRKNAITKFLKSQDEKFHMKVGLSIVRLDGKKNDESSRVAWICDECYKKYKAENRVHDL